jgi:hypothetical protein
VSFPPLKPQPGSCYFNNRPSPSIFLLDNDNDVYHDHHYCGTTTVNSMGIFSSFIIIFIIIDGEEYTTMAATAVSFVSTAYEL